LFPETHQDEFEWGQTMIPSTETNKIMTKVANRMEFEPEQINMYTVRHGNYDSHTANEVSEFIDLLYQ
jgi:hypothetical protein